MLKRKFNDNIIQYNNLQTNIEEFKKSVLECSICFDQIKAPVMYVLIFPVSF